MRDAVSSAASWREALDALGYAYDGKSIARVRKWSAHWGIDTGHLSDHTGRRPRPRYSDAELEKAVAASVSYAETLRRLGSCPTGGNWRTLKRHIQRLGLSTAHFDPYAASRRPRNGRRIPLDQVLVAGSTYSRTSLKQRLYQAGLKKRCCELCGQGEIWQGRTISLILDHANGIRDDNRLENLRIVCPNCAAGLDTHCGRKNRIEIGPRECRRCARSFIPRHRDQRYCSRYCGVRWDRAGVTRLGARTVARPPYEQLIKELDETSFAAVGRRYGVSDNAVRKRVRVYENERERRRRDQPKGSENG